jgi:hypothetical protein
MEAGHSGETPAPEAWRALVAAAARQGWLLRSGREPAEGQGQGCRRPGLTGYGRHQGAIAASLILLHQHHNDHQLKREFTQASLSTVLPLKSVYAIRIYLLLKQYRGIGQRALSLEAMREMLGIAKNQYVKYHDFKKRVILTAQRELDRKTDLGFEFQEEKAGKSVVGMVFQIRDPIRPEPGGRRPAPDPPAVSKPPAMTPEQRQKAREGVGELRRTLQKGRA